MLPKKVLPLSKETKGSRSHKKGIVRSLFNRLQDDRIAVGLAENAHRDWRVFADLLVPLMAIPYHLANPCIAGRIEADIFSIRCQHSKRRCRCCHRAIGV